MNINKCILLTMLFVSSDLCSQNRYDNNWIFSHGNQGILLNFLNDTIHIGLLPEMNMHTEEANVSMSDSVGNLLFYSNNCKIANSTFQTMENGENLNPGLIQDQYCSNGGHPVQQSIISVPKPLISNLFYVFHTDLEFFNFGSPGGTDYAPMHLYYSLIDINANNGAGSIVQKNIALLEDTLAWGSLEVVRHANGRDWWLICPEYRTNCYYIILIDPNGTQVISKQCLGNIWGKYGATGGTQFTSDGEKYIRSHSDNGLNIFNFDRCTGMLSDPLYISLNPDTNKISGLAISGNSRFIYVTFLDKIFQYDLLSSDIAGSKALVAEYDGFKSAGNSTNFYYSKLAPDGKIYICSDGPTYYLHTINKPNILGTGCEVLQHNVLLPIPHFATMPNGPNFRLKAKPSPCDTINVTAIEVNKQNALIYVFPNPANSFVEFSYSKLIETPSHFRLTNIYGSLITSCQIWDNSEMFTFPVDTLPSGVYFWEISTTHGVYGHGRLLIQH